MAAKPAGEPPPISKFQSLWAVALAIMIVVASGRSQVAGPDISHIDKITHFAVYGLLATLVCRLACSRASAVWSLLIVSGFGATDEWHQTFTPGRTLEFADWIADSCGAAVAIALYRGWTWYRSLLEMPLFRSRRATP